MIQSKKDKKKRIIAIADKLFARYGIQKTTMDEIARAARMGKATLYHYFKSKEEVFAAVIRNEAYMLYDKVIEAMSHANNSEEKLRCFILTRMQHLDELRNYFSMFKDEFLEQYEFINQEIKNFSKLEIAHLKSILDEGVEQKKFDIADTQETARIISIAFVGLETLFFFDIGDVHVEKDAKIMVECLLKGILTR